MEERQARQELAAGHVESAVRETDIPSASPRKKQKVCHGMHPPENQIVESLRELFGGVVAKTKVSIKGALVDLSELKSVGSRKVLQCSVADQSAVISVTLWSPVADKMWEQMKEKFTQSPDQQFAKFAVVGCEVVEVQAQPWRIVKLQSTRLTEVKFICYEGLIIQPAKPMVVDDFSELREAHIKAILHGTLCELGEVVHSQQGLPMRPGKLVDHSGTAIPLVLHSAHALDSDLQNGTQVTLFFAHALPGIMLHDGEERSGSWFVYEDAFVLEHGKRAVPPIRKVQNLPSLIQ